MKKITCLMVFLGIFWAGAAWAKAPKSLAGFVLGQNVKQYSQLCDMGRAIPAPDEVFLQEVPLLDGAVPGVRIGYLYLGSCAKPGQLVRVKLKFRDTSKGFFNQMLELYRNSWGKPDSYRGDPFQNHVSWKWSFTQEGGGRISLILSYSRDTQESFGNIVKMSLRNAWEEERACWVKLHSPQKKVVDPGDEKPVNLSDLVPK